MNRRLKVCIVAPSLDILGGQAVAAQRLMRRLHAEGDIDLSFIPHNPRLPRVLLWLQRIKYIRTLVTSAAYVLLLLVRLRDVDVVHVFSASYWSFLLAPTPAVLIAKMYRKRVLLNYRSGEAADHLTRWRSSALPIVRLADEVIVPSAYLVDVFAHFAVGARAIANFADIERIPFRVRERRRPVFLSNRNFAPLYDVACTLRAFRVIQDTIPTAQLTVAGDGEQRIMLADLATQLGLRNVRFVGQASPEEMAKLYDAADIYLNSPKIDNMPNSIIEAFAAGLVVVTTRAGGIPYVVNDGATGLLSDVGDHTALAANALRVLEDQEFGQRLASNARAEVLSKYTWPAVRQAWRSAYGLASAATRRDAGDRSVSAQDVL